MKPAKVDMSQIIPQRPPFIMIDRIVDYEYERVVTEMLVKPDNIFLKDGFFMPAGIIENIAQSCAARIGYDAWLNGLPVRIGLIGAVKKFNLFTQPGVNDTLLTTITVIGEAFGMVLVNAEVYADEHHVASAEVKIALTDDKME